jgi:ankyrin repeat protein
LNQADKKLSEDDLDSLSIPAFFDGINLYFSPEDSPEMFDRNHVHYHHNPSKTFTAVLPEILMEQKKIDKEASHPAIVELKNNWNGTYDIKELSDYLDLLTIEFKKKDLKEPITFSLGRLNHTITISFEPETKGWRVIDPNQLDILVQTTDDAKTIANHVFRAFGGKDHVTFNTRVYVNKNTSDKVNECIEACQTTPAWLEMHDIKVKMNILPMPALEDLLSTAARNGDNMTVRALLGNISTDKKVNVNATSKFGTAMNVAANFGHTDVVETLLKEKANLDTKDRVGSTPLYLASYTGYADTVKFLLTHGANPNVVGHSNNTPLHVASENGHLDVVDQLIRSKKIDLNCKNTAGKTPLHTAIIRGHLPVVQRLVEELVESKGNVNEAYSDKPPFYLAAKEGQVDIISYFLEQKNIDVESGITMEVKTLQKLFGKDAWRLDNILPLNHQPLYFTPLHAAILHGHYQVVKKLLEFGANPNNFAGGITPFELAKVINKPSIIAILRKYQILWELKARNVNPAIITKLQKLDESKVDISLGYLKKIEGLEYKINLATDSYKNTKNQERIAAISALKTHVSLAYTHFSKSKTPTEELKVVEDLENKIKGIISNIKQNHEMYGALSWLTKSRLARKLDETMKFSETSTTYKKK